MPTMLGRTTVNGASQVDNVLAGQTFEFLRQHSHISIGLSGDSSMPIGDVIADIFSGSDILCTAFPVPPNGPISIDRDMYFDDDALAGDRLVIRLRNTTASTPRAVNWLVQITEL